MLLFSLPLSAFAISSQNIRRTVSNSICRLPLSIVSVRLPTSVCDCFPRSLGATLTGFLQRAAAVPLGHLRQLLVVNLVNFGCNKRGQTKSIIKTLFILVANFQLSAAEQQSLFA